MNPLEHLETSYNRIVQKQIFAQLDRIDAAKDLFLSEKYKHRLHFNEQTKDLVAERNLQKRCWGAAGFSRMNAETCREHRNRV